MRIRTIKPEFWSHERLSSLSCQARLLAIALLNFSDDDGFFNANPKLVGATLFPYDSWSIPVLFHELLTIGYVEFKKCEGGSCEIIGRVVKFAEHQVISHAKDSSLKTCFDSSNVPVTFQEASILKGKERKGMEGKGITPPIPLKGVSLDDPFISELKKNFPGVDVEEQFRKISQWKLHPKNCKRVTTKRFLLNWFMKADSEVNIENGSKPYRSKWTEEQKALLNL